jgi:agmatine/peptidylarginine deiminase
MKHVFTLLLALFFLAASSPGQVPTISAKQQKQRLPASDMRRLAPPPVNLRAAPSGPVHAVAEWEESEGVMMLWWNHDLVNRLQEVNKVYIPVDDNAEKTSWEGYLTSNGIPLTNIEFLFIQTDTVWTRDYGPWFIWDADNVLGISDYSCDKHGAVYGPNDNAFPRAFATLFGINYYDSGMEHVGGNWYPNGYATAFSSNRVYTMNPYDSMEQTNGTIKDYWGTETYRTAPVAPWTIEHLDCWIKPVNPGTVIVVKYEESSDYAPYAKYINEYYETLMSPWGRPYEIHRLPMFKMGSGWYEYKPYCNSLLSNERVYVPITYTADDQTAMDLFQEAYEGYEIVGVDHMGMGFNDAVHCRTRNFHTRELIRIYPMPPGDTEDTVSGYPVSAEVIPPNGSSLLAGHPRILWTATGGAPFNEVAMTATGQPNEYAGDIPAQSLGTEVSFYIEAKDDGGLTAIYPLVAPDGMMHFQVRADTEPPHLQRFIRLSGTDSWPPTIRVLCKDDMATPEVKVTYQINGTPQSDVALSRESGTYWYSGALSGSVTPGDLVTYRIEAEDGAANAAKLPLIGDTYCPVDTGTVAVVELGHNPRTGAFISRTLGDLGIAYTYYTTWPADWTAHEVWFISIGVHFCSNHVLSTSEADDIVGALQSGASIYLESNDTWCWDPAKTILDPWFKVNEISDGGDLNNGVKGESGTIMDGLWLDYAGENAYMDQIGAQSGAEMLFRSGDNKGRGVIYDGSGYRTIAASFGLGGLVDGGHPDTRKEILVRMLQFFGVEVGLYAGTEAIMGESVPVRIFGDAGDIYLLLGSVGDNFVTTGYGDFRLDPSWLFYVYQNVIPAGGSADLWFPLPRDPAYDGIEIHLQAVVGEALKVGKAQLTNREVLTLVE